MKTQDEIIVDIINNLRDTIISKIVDINKTFKRFEERKDQAILYLLNEKLGELYKSLHDEKMTVTDFDEISREIEKVKWLINNLYK